MAAASPVTAKPPPAPRPAPKRAGGKQSNSKGNGKLSEVEVQAIFKEFDVDGSGSIDREELQDLVFALGVVMTPAEVEDAFATVDSDGSGEIDWDEFLAWFTSQSGQGNSGVSRRLRMKLQARFLKRKAAALRNALSGAAQQSSSALQGLTPGQPPADTARLHLQATVGDVSTEEPPLGAYLTLEPAVPSGMAELGAAEADASVVYATFSLLPEVQDGVVAGMVATANKLWEQAEELVQEELELPMVSRVVMEGPLSTPTGGRVVMVKVFMSLDALGAVQESVGATPDQAGGQPLRLYKYVAAALQSSLTVGEWLGQGDADISAGGVRAELCLDLARPALLVLQRAIRGNLDAMRASMQGGEEAGAGEVPLLPDGTPATAEMLGRDDSRVAQAQTLPAEDGLEGMLAAMARPLEMAASGLGLASFLRDKTTRLAVGGFPELLSALAPTLATGAADTAEGHAMGFVAEDTVMDDAHMVAAMLLSPATKLAALLSLPLGDLACMAPSPDMDEEEAMAASAGGVTRTFLRSVGSLDRLALASKSDTLALDLVGLDFPPLLRPLQFAWGLEGATAPEDTPERTELELFAFGTPTGGALATVQRALHAAEGLDAWEVKAGLCSEWNLSLPHVDAEGSTVFQDDNDFADVTQQGAVSTLVSKHSETGPNEGTVFVVSALKEHNSPEAAAAAAAYLAAILKARGGDEDAGSPKAPLLILAVNCEQGGAKVPVAQLEKSLGLHSLQGLVGETKAFHASAETLRGVYPALQWLDTACAKWHATQ